MNPRRSGVWLSCSVLVLLCGSVHPAEEPEGLEVPVVRPLVREVTDYESFTGRTEAISRVDLRPRVSGYLLEASFQKGAEVKKGEMLFKIDARPYQADLDRAEAQLRLAEARLKLADANLARAKALPRQGVSKEEMDQVVTEQVVAAATVRAARASRESAQLYLDFTHVTAPIAGYIGRRLVDPGNLVKADETLLATIVDQDSLAVFFDVDERTVLRLRRGNQAKGGKQSVFIGLADEEHYSRRAEIDSSDNQVNPQTGALRVRALLLNKDRLLSPGMFVRVRLVIGAPYKALLVPPEAVLTETEGGRKYVYVVNDRGVIESRTVTLGPAAEGRRSVREGLKQGDRVVVGRQQRLRPGMTVRPVEGARPREAPPPAKPPAPAKPEAETRSVPCQSGPVFLVEARYPGANAAVVADTVASPIEEQVRGMEGLLSLRSRCSNDGKYTLAATFVRGSDPQLSHVLQNHINLAMPVVPEVVRQLGVTSREQAPGVAMIVALRSPEGVHDTLYLSKYARTQNKDELTRLPGVAGATLVGADDYGVRIWLDTARLAARDLTVAEVMGALREQNQSVKPQAGGNKEGQAAITREGETSILVHGRLRSIDPETLADIVLKAREGGPIVRLKDVARIELAAAQPHSRAALDGKPAVILALHARGNVTLRKLHGAVRDRVAELRSRLPDGLALTVPFDFTSQSEGESRAAAAAHLLLDLDLPPAASAQRRDTMMEHAEALLRRVRGVRSTLALSENPFDLLGGAPCILVALAPEQGKKTGEIEQAIRSRLDEIKEITVRVRDLSAPGALPRCAYPVELAIHGPERAQVRDFTRKLAERLERSKKLKDVGLNPGAVSQPMLNVEIDRNRCQTLGVKPPDVFNTLQVYLGSGYVNDFTRFGRTWQVVVQAGASSDEQVKDLGKLKVRNDKGDMVSLGAVASFRKADGAVALDRFDSNPMIEITANPSSGVSRDEARTLCNKLADEVRRELRLPASYRLSWLD